MTLRRKCFSRLLPVLDKPIRRHTAVRVATFVQGLGELLARCFLNLRQRLGTSLAINCAYVTLKALKFAIHSP